MEREKRKMSQKAAWILFLWLLFACVAGCEKESAATEETMQEEMQTETGGDTRQEEMLERTEEDSAKESDGDTEGTISLESQSEEETEDVWETEVVPVTIELLMKFELMERTEGEVGNWLLWPGDVTIKTGKVDGEEVKMYSMPYVEHWIGNIHAPSPTAWRVRFRVAEFTERDGERIYGENAVRYRDVKLTLQAGENSMFTEKHLTASLWDKQGERYEKTKKDPMRPNEGLFIEGNLEGYYLTKKTQLGQQRIGDWIELTGTLEFVRPQETAEKARRFLVFGKILLSYEVWDEEEGTVRFVQDEKKFPYWVIEMG